MKVKIVSPVKAQVVDIKDSELEVLKKELSYKNTSNEYKLKKLEENHYFKRTNPKGYDAYYKKLKNEVFINLLKQEKGTYTFYPGSIPSLSDKLNIEVVENLVGYPEFKKFPWKKELPFELYPYQKEAIELLLKEKHANVVSATGSGKTAVIMSLVRNTGLRTIVMVPTQGIFWEVYNSLVEHLGANLVGAFGDGKKDIKKQITVAIGKSLTMLKEKSPNHEFFQQKQVAIFDECHLLPSATLEKVCHGVLKDVPYKYFLTATHLRNDGAGALLNAITGKTVMEFGIREAIKGGYLCPLKFMVMTVKQSSKRFIKDPIENKREHFIRNGNIGNKIVELIQLFTSKNMSVLVLVDELAQIGVLHDVFKEDMLYAHSGAKAEAEEVGLTNVDVSDAIFQFNLGKKKILAGTSCINTGVNIFPTHVTINWVGGSSEIVVKQGAIGRSTRKLELSKFNGLHKEKPFSLIIDFDVKGNWGLERSLEKRIEMYEETGCDVVKMNL